MLQQLGVTSSVGAAAALRTGIVGCFLPFHSSIWSIQVPPPPQHKLLHGPTVRYLFFARDVYLPEPTAHVAGVCTSSPKGCLSFWEEAANGAVNVFVPEHCPEPTCPCFNAGDVGLSGYPAPYLGSLAPLSPHVDRHPPVMLKSVFYILSSGRVGTS